MAEYTSLYEKERKKKIPKNIESEEEKLQRITKEHANTVNHSKINLKELKDLVKEWWIDIEKAALDKIQKDDKLDDKELNNVIESVEFKEIVEKIEEIMNNPDIDTILPKDLRINPQEFKDACKDKTKRPALLQKIDTALDCVNDQVRSWWSKIGGNPFARNINMRENLMFLANKKIISVQEHMINMKNYLNDN